MSLHLWPFPSHTPFHLIAHRVDGRILTDSIFCLPVKLSDVLDHVIEFTGAGGIDIQIGATSWCRKSTSSRTPASSISTTFVPSV